jgi:hypothetical protein
VIKLNRMATFYDVPGEFGHVMIGKDHACLAVGHWDSFRRRPGHKTAKDETPGVGLNALGRK